MSTTLFFLVPIGMLAVVWSLCFVGVCFPTTGTQGPPSPPYSNTILKELSLIAYWPLSDALNSQLPMGAPALPMPPTGSAGVAVALDLTGNNHNGTYINPPLYMSGTTFLTTMGNPPVDNAPTLDLHQTSIVPGDAFAPGSKNTPFCVDFEGGYVSIPWAAKSPSLADFTLEAWIKPKWNSTTFNWVLFSARTNNNTGFVVHINNLNHWQLTVGNTAGVTVIDTMVQASVDGMMSYVAVTFDSTSQLLSLWIDPVGDTSAPPTPAWPPSPNMTTSYSEIDPTEAVTFFIGAGGNQQAPRTQAMGAGAPLDPFQGLIQSVALYSSALSPPDLASHFAAGSGSGADDGS
jgi:hypothetical protein